MRSRSVQTVFLVAALFVVSAIPAAGQTNAFSAGLTFLSDNGGVGIAADISKGTNSRANNQGIGWVFDGSYSHKGFDFASVNSAFASGGVRFGGKVVDRVTWHVQGTAGIAHAAATIADVPTATNFIVMPGFAGTYWFSEKRA